MEIKVFSDIIDAIGKVWNNIKGFAEIPKKERAYYREQFSETLTLIESAIILIIVRLGDLLATARSGELNVFKRELFRLEDYDDWLNIEREVRICSNLRVARREMSSIINKFKARISIKDVDELQTKFDEILSTERELADYIAFSLQELSELGSFNDNEVENVKNEIIDFKNALKAERLKLINIEKNIIEII